MHIPVLKVLYQPLQKELLFLCPCIHVYVFVLQNWQQKDCHKIWPCPDNALPEALWSCCLTQIPIVHLLHLWRRQGHLVKCVFLKIWPHHVNNRFVYSVFPMLLILIYLNLNVFRSILMICMYLQKPLSITQEYMWRCSVVTMKRSKLLIEQNDKLILNQAKRL